MSLLTRDYDYDLPRELIASRPLARRDAARMMVLHRAEQRIGHCSFSDFPSYLRDSDLAVLNDTRVIPARVFSDDGKVELLFLEASEAAGKNVWKCLAKPGKKLRLNNVVTIGGVAGRVVEITSSGERVIRFDAPIDLEKIGQLPIPHYMKRDSDAQDTERYQTVYARTPGAVAAPTAGLHFTPEILEKIPHTFVTLHVGVGTFKPVKTERVTEHVMHRERFSISENAAREINTAKNRKGRIFAIGTTTVRVLESCALQNLKVGEADKSDEENSDEKIRAEQNGATEIFIHPPFRFQIVDALLTNFHLPKSTLLMLVSAFAGREFMLRAYAEAVRERYRFYSYGDCMLIV
jgi:S-adenosylmethionine:tRNA ribosyltransferase-isomerase